MRAGQEFFGNGPKIGLFDGGGEGPQVILGLQGVIPGDGPGVVQRAVLIQETPQFRGRLRGQILGDGLQALPVREAMAWARAWIRGRVMRPSLRSAQTCLPNSRSSPV